MEHGIKKILPGLKLKKRRTAEGYQVYNEAVQSVREQLQLTPQAMDIVLTLASKEADTTASDDFERSSRSSWAVSWIRRKGRNTSTATVHCGKRRRRTSSTSARWHLMARTLPMPSSEDAPLRGHGTQSQSRCLGTRRTCDHQGCATILRGAEWTKPEDWPAVSKAIFEFVRHCVDHPEALAEHCKCFAASVPSKGLQMGMLSPDPERPQARSLQYHQQQTPPHAEFPLRDELRQCPSTLSRLEQLCFDFQEEAQGRAHQVLGQDIAFSGDVLDMFSHWLVAIRKLSFKEAKVFERSPQAQVPSIGKVAVTMATSASAGMSSAI